MKAFKEKIRDLFDDYEKLVTRKNIPVEGGNGIFTRYQYPVLTAAHTPVFWRYDLDEKTNPFLMERIGMNATLNSGAIKWNGKYLLVVRVEGADRKSLFAVAESPDGIDNFRFWDYPVTMPEDIIPATNIYDMRLTAHEDGWIYGIFHYISEGCSYCRFKYIDMITFSVKEIEKNIFLQKAILELLKQISSVSWTPSDRYWYEHILIEFP